MLKLLFYLITTSETCQIYFGNLGLYEKLMHGDTL